MSSRNAWQSSTRFQKTARMTLGQQLLTAKVYLSSNYVVNNARPSLTDRDPFCVVVFWTRTANQISVTGRGENNRNSSRSNNIAASGEPPVSTLACCASPPGPPLVDCSLITTRTSLFCLLLARSSPPPPPLVLPDPGLGRSHT